MRSTRISITLALILACALLAGCNIVAPAVAVLSGPPTRGALYDLDQGGRVVIFIDDLDSVLPRRSLRRVIGETAERELIRKKVLAPEQLIRSDAANAIAESDTASSYMSIVDVGLALEADTVVYVSLTSFSISRDMASISPQAIARVKIFDTGLNQRVWPGDPEGYLLNMTVPKTAGQQPSTRSEVSQIQMGLAQSLGIKLAQMFFKTEVSRFDNLAE
ncbi:MAG: hypothetical protein AAGD00_08885 [Planctomycetota bacterium]